MKKHVRSLITNQGYLSTQKIIFSIGIVNGFCHNSSGQGNAYGFCFGDRDLNDKPPVRSHAIRFWNWKHLTPKIWCRFTEISREEKVKWK
jgi:hypothetical protein